MFACSLLILLANALLFGVLVKKYVFSAHKKLVFLYVFALLGQFVGVGVAYSERRSLYRLIAPFFKKTKRVVKTPMCACNWDSFDSLRRDKYYKHRSAAQKLTNTKHILNVQMQQELMDAGVLKIIPKDSGLKVLHMDYGSPYLHEHSLDALLELDRRFQEELTKSQLPQMKLVISSATRTEEQQVAIREQYPLAATSKASSHSFGGSVDLPYIEGQKCTQGVAV